MKYKGFGKNSRQVGKTYRTTVTKTTIAVPVSVGLRGKSIADLGNIVDGVCLLHLTGLLGLSGAGGSGPARACTRWRALSGLHGRSTGCRRHLSLPRHAAGSGVATIVRSSAVGVPETRSGLPHRRRMRAGGSCGHHRGSTHSTTGVHTSATDAAAGVRCWYLLSRVVECLFLGSQFDFVTCKHENHQFISKWAHMRTIGDIHAPSPSGKNVLKPRMSLLYPRNRFLTLSITPGVLILQRNGRVANQDPMQQTTDFRQSKYIGFNNKVQYNAP